MRLVGSLLLVLSTVLVLAPAVQAEDATLPPPVVIKRPAARAPAPPAPPAPVAPQGWAPTPTPATGTPPPPPPPPPPPGGIAPTTPMPPGDALAEPPAWTQRDIQRRVDAYLEHDQPLFAPSAMPGFAGYDGGFRFRTAGFRLAIQTVLQARYEAWLADGTAPAPGGDLSGFSLPRAILRLSGTSEPSFHYRIELDFGHHGARQAGLAPAAGNLGPRAPSGAYDILREAWVQWSPVNVINVRAGLLRTPNTRQLLVQPEHQQFVDLSLGSAWTGLSMPGYTDRNRDYGVMLHGTYGPREEFSYMLSITNGDGGDDVRAVLDQRTSDNSAYAGRINYAFFDAIGPREGALRQCVGKPYGEVGLWAFTYDDRLDAPHRRFGDYLRYGADLALGYGPWSLTGAYTVIEDDAVPGAGVGDSSAWLAQAGHHFVGTPFEVAARWSGYDADGGPGGGGTVQELGFTLNLYLDGHRHKLQLDGSWLDTEAGAPLLLDPYTGYSGRVTPGDDAWLLRFQWQLAL